MRSTYTVDSILGTRSKVAVLRVLRGVRIPLNASQVAARTGITHTAATSALRDLARMGIVRSSSAGRANVHSLERDNIYVERVVEPAFEAEELIPEAMIEEVREAFEDLAVSVVLFGSYSRGDQDASSDVDVVLVAGDQPSKDLLERKAEDYALAFRTRFGATLSPLVYDLREAGSLSKIAPGLAEAIRQDALVVSGLDPRDWPTRG